jgi:hypothetical protein
MLAYYTVSNTTAGFLYVKLCPACIASLALDNASVITGIVGWLLICISNSVLYAILGLFPALIIGFARRNSGRDATLLSVIRNDSPSRKDQ